ncbi:MAG: HAD-IA family hydrolase, partial [Schleiferiaceae bacterium]
DASYFNYVLEHMNAQPEEVLFVDDSPANIEAAEALGINTFLFNLQDQDLAKELPAVLAKFD